jgi:hypothetical protein
MPITAGLILSELVAEARNSKTPFYIALEPFQRLFEVRSSYHFWKKQPVVTLYAKFIHVSKQTVVPNDVKSFSCIHKNGSISESVQELQGVRQGGIWSPTAYSTLC